MLHECLEKRIVIDVMMSSAYRKPTLLDEEWDLVQKFVILLKPLKDGASVAIQSKAPTSNEAILIIKGLMRNLERIKVEISNSSILLIRHLTCRFCASLKHKDDGQTKFIKPNSQRQDIIIKYWVSIGSIHREQG